MQWVQLEVTARYDTSAVPLFPWKIFVRVGRRPEGPGGRRQRRRYHMGGKAPLPSNLKLTISYSTSDRKPALWVFRFWCRPVLADARRAPRARRFTPRPFPEDILFSRLPHPRDHHARTRARRDARLEPASLSHAARGSRGSGRGAPAAGAQTGRHRSPTGRSQTLPGSSPVGRSDRRPSRTRRRTVPRPSTRPTRTSEAALYGRGDAAGERAGYSRTRRGGGAGGNARS